MAVSEGRLLKRVADHGNNQPERSVIGLTSHGMSPHECKAIVNLQANLDVIERNLEADMTSDSDGSSSGVPLTRDSDSTVGGADDELVSQESESD